MLYHVVIEKKPAKNGKAGVEENKTDLTKEQLIARFIEPYEQGNPITVNGTTIQTSEINRLTVKATESSIESLIPAIEAEDRNSSVFMIGGPSYLERAIYRATDVTDEFITGPAGSKKSTSSQKPSKSTANSNSNKVFIVHGHDDAAKTKTARFVEQLDYKAIILHEQASSGRTIIEKIEQYTDVGFAVVLYTPDDIGNSKGNADNLQLRARQNVVFEHGFLIGKLGRDRVVALVDGAIELPNDISGVVYIKMDEANAWHLQLAKEMKQAGFDIDMNKLV
ncbi:TIR domain-containing protein [Enterobacter asburiae]